MSFRNRRLASAVPKWMPLHDLCLRALLVSPQLFLRRDVRLILWEKDRWTDGQSRWPIISNRTEARFALHDLCLQALLAYPHLFLQRYVRFALWGKDRWTKEALQGSALL